MKKILFVLMLTVIGNTFTAPKSQKTKNTRITTSRISENDRKEIENTLTEIEKIVNMSQPPKLSRKSICGKCAYYEFCFI